MTSQPHDLGAGEVIIDGKLHRAATLQCPRQKRSTGCYVKPLPTCELREAHICSQKTTRTLSMRINISAVCL